MAQGVLVHDKALKQALNDAVAKVKDPAYLLSHIGNTVKEQTRLRFIDGVAPSGAPWKPVLRGGRPLRDTGVHLMNAINSRVTGKAVSIGVPYAWASVHQFGQTIKVKKAPYLRFQINGKWYAKKQVTIPARPMFGINAANADELKKQIAHFLSWGTK